MSQQLSTLSEQYSTEEQKPKIKRFSDSYLTGMLWRFLSPYWWQILCVIVMLFMVSGLQLLLPLLVQQAVDGPITEGNLDGLIPLGIGYIVATAAMFVIRFGYLYWLATIGQNALMNLRQTLYEHILKQDLRYFNKTPVGQVVARMSNDIEALTELLSTSVVILASNIVTLVGIVIVMLLLNWQLALISLAIIPVMVVLSVYYRGRMRTVARRFHRIRSAYLAYINEQFNGMLVVQLFNRQRKTLDDFEVINKDYFDVHMNLRDSFTQYWSLLQLMTTIGLAIVLWGGGQGVLAQWPGVTIGILIAFIEYVRQSFEPILVLSEQFAQIQSAFSAGERIARMLHTHPEVREPDNPKRVADFDPSVTFEQVKFGYDPTNLVLKGIDLHIEPGQRVAIVGATGAGKTTLVKLLARYYDVTDGSVQIGGVDLRELSFKDLRRFVTVVPQDPYCFNGTIGDNLRLFDRSITQQQMEKAAEIACAKPFIEALPGGFDYELLPGGANLSQGQRQLLALARALIHSPESILVLDEATSNIDTETEAYIQDGLAQVLANRTSLIIAHRLSTIVDADRILVMREGQVIEDGTHDELLERGGMYAGLYYRQFADQGASIDDLLSEQKPQPQAS